MHLDGHHVEGGLAHAVLVPGLGAVHALGVGGEPDGAQCTRDLDHAGALGLKQQRDKGLGNEHGAKDVGREGLGEALAAYRAGRGGAGIADEGIDAPKLLGDAVYGRRDGGVVLDVQLENTERALAAAGLELGECMLALGDIAAGEDYMVAWLGRNGLGRGVANARVGAWIGDLSSEMTLLR